MILGLDGHTLFHVAISLVGIAVGFVVLGGFLADARLDGAIHTFLATTVATNVTGFLFPFNGFLPSYAVGIISLIVLGVAIYAYYGARLAGSWRAIFVIASVVTLSGQERIGLRRRCRFANQQIGAGECKHLPCGGGRVRREVPEQVSYGWIDEAPLALKSVSTA